MGFVALGLVVGFATWLGWVLCVCGLGFGAAGWMVGLALVLILVGVAVDAVGGFWVLWVLWVVSSL